jgi:trimeric autotransporter adhesin
MNKTSAAIVRSILLGTSCLSMLAAGTTHAQPTGGTIALGSGTISTSGSSTTVIDQTTGKLVINWDSFSIGAGGTVQFNQPGTSAIALNRVLGSEPTSIYGNLLANGQVWIINGNGVLFGKGSQIQVGGLLATTSDIRDADFAAGNYSFSGGTGAAVVNQGTIAARSGGSVVLSGASAQNQGLIAAQAGTVVIGGASAFTVDFNGDGLLSYAITAPAQTADNGQTGSFNSGTIQAQGGRVIMTARAAASVQDAVVNNTGMISATSARVANGEVILDGGDGNVAVSGTIDVSGKGSGQTGGSVTVTGHAITVADGATIDASGNAGGGTIKIGGDLHGGGTTPHAASVTVGQATINADATVSGNGGTLVIWSDGETSFGGTVSLTGGAHGGNGGLVETSGHTLSVASTATVNTTAPKGQTGTWLLDPDFIVITSGEGGSLIGGTINLADHPSGTDYISASTVTNALATTNVSLQAAIEIDVYSDLNYTSAHSLSLLSKGDIYIAANVQNAGTGAINVIAGWDGATTDPAHFTDTGVYGNGGNVYVTSDYDLDPNEAYSSEAGEGEAHGVAIGSAGGTTTVAGTDVQVLGYFGYSQIGFHGGGGTGDIVVKATGGVTLTASALAGCSGCDAQIGNGGVFANGDNGGNISVSAQGDVTLTAGANAYSFAQIGNGGDSSTGSDSGNVVVNSGDAVLVNGGNDYAQIGNGGWGASGDDSGNVTVVAGNDIQLMANVNGNYGSIQIGNGGQRASGSFSGDISVTAGGDLMLTSGGNPDFVQIGNGAADGSATSGSSTGNATGDISVNVGGQTTFDTTSGGEAWLGNYAAGGGTESGNVTFITGTASDGGSGLIGTMIAADLSGGDVTFGMTDGDLYFGGVSYSSSHDLTLMSMSAVTISDSIVNSGSGNINIVAGWDGQTFGMSAIEQAGAYGGENTTTIGGSGAESGVYVGSASGATTVLTGNLDVSAVYGYAQLGYHGAGSGNITVLATGDMTLTGSNSAGDYAMIGNGSLNGDVTDPVAGDIDINVGGMSLLQPGTNLNNAWIGNYSTGGFTGNVMFVSGNIDGSGHFGANIASDLAGGDVTIGITDSEANTHVDDTIAYSSGHAFNLLTAGSVVFDGQLQNDGSGAINVVAGWDGTTVDPAHFGDAGVFGSNGGTITIGGGKASGDSALGSAGGATNLYADLVNVDAVNGYAQLGYHGQATGAINMLALGAVTLTGGEGISHYAQIGSGSSFLSNAGAGDVTIDAGSISSTNPAAVVADALSLTTSDGGIGASGSSLQFAANTLTVQTNGADVYLSSPGQGVSLTSVDVGSGDFQLAAGGAITQTGAISASTLDVSTTSGAITLNGSGNSFGTLHVATTGSDSANVKDSTGVVVSGASVGGTFTLNASGTITQSGAISASTLDVSTTSGAITLNGSGNSFGTLHVSTTNSNANIKDSTGVAVSGASVGSGTFTLSAGGAITQSGALSASTLTVSTTSGAITLTDGSNSFSTLHVSTTGSNNVSVTDSIGFALGTSTVGGTLTLNAGGAITQSGALSASTLTVSTTSGAIALTDTGNSFATLNVSTSGTDNASLTDSTALAVASATVGGKLTLSAGGAITQTAAIHAGGLAASTTSGAMLLNNAANIVTGLATFSGPGAVTFANSVGTILGASSVGGDFTILSMGDVTVVGSTQSTTGAITLVAGWDGTTTSSAHFGDSGVFGNGGGTVTIGGAMASGPVRLGSQSGATTIYASALNIQGTNAYAQLGYHGSGGGAITVRTLHDVTLAAGAGNAFLGNGSLGNDVTGNITGDIDVRAGGNIVFNDSPGGQAWLGNVAHSGTETGNVTLVANDMDSTATNRVGDIVAAAIVGGDVTLGFTGGGDQGPQHDVSYSSSHTLNVLTTGNFVDAASLQNAGTGAINIVAGWDGQTLSPASFGNAGVSGNNNKGVIIGGAHASGNAAVGSAGGTTSIYGASLALTATNGYAQLGFHGHGAGAIMVDVSGGVTLAGGATTGDFAQIGNGGLGTSGDNSGAITITAGGDLTMTGGAGVEAYAQIGHGGAESNTAANGYSNQGAITLAAANVTLNGGAGNAAYAMIGQGGFKAGLNLAGGTATNSGDITVTAAHQITLAGNGTDSFVQIGNGGSQSNLNPVASAGGTDSGVVTVTAPNGPQGALSLTAGAGANSYAQIGNGGYSVNTGLSSTAANFTVTGNVTVADLTLTGGGNNGFSLIGNGDPTQTGFGNISGDIIIDANGNIIYTPGTGFNSWATIGNFTGQGTVSGSVDGAEPPPVGSVNSDPGTIGVVVTTVAGNGQNNSPPPITTVNTVVVTTTTDDTGTGGLHANIGDTTPPGPLASLDTNGADSSTPNVSDGATVVIADSLDGSQKPSVTHSILAGVLTQVTPSGAGHTAHGVPPADQDFSSWGNEALWQ